MNKNNYAFTSHTPVVGIPIKGSSYVFPARRVICVAHNYLSHFQEVGEKIISEEPTFYFKPVSSVVKYKGDLDHLTIEYPPKTDSYKYEVNAVIALSSGGKNLSKKHARSCILGVTCGLDMSRADLLDHAKKYNTPWDMAKGADQSCIIGHIDVHFDLESIYQRNITLKQNAHTQQTSNLRHMIWNFENLVSLLSHYITLEAGDILFTGTPSGSAEAERGDEICIELESHCKLYIDID